MAETINGYTLTTKFSTSNAGMCQWAFARKNGHDYFIKQLLFPKYPMASAEKKLSPAIVRAMELEANTFYSQRRVFYEKLQECRTGNVVVVENFFRENEFYYIVTDKVNGPFLSLAQISALSEEKKRTLLKAILYSIVQIHDRGIVHSDLKPENIMIRETAKGYCTAKLIDFDSGFFEYDIPEEIVGDQRYYSPEAILRNDERDVDVTVKSDIFALGLLFHQYWCGDFPGFDNSKYDSASIALLNRDRLHLSPYLPHDIRYLISRMLSKHQEGRPTAREAWEELSGKKMEDSSPKPVDTGSGEGGFRPPTEDDLA